MAVAKLEQLLHGYRRGHEQLNGSVKLTSRDAELVTRLSDLSGSLSNSPRFASYLTVYPLPSGEYFALAKTWPDTDASRAGCVLTHTLLVPTPVWSVLPEPRILDKLFKLPTSATAHEFNSAISMPESPPQKDLGIQNIDQNALLAFVNLYFGEGKRPVVWFGLDQPENILWLLLGGLWPKLRVTFSACTLCLQPRVLEDRSFELMFAPAEVYSRFAKITPDHFVDATVQPIRPNEAELWRQELTRRLFGPTGSRMLPREFELWSELDDDPTIIRRLFLIEALTSESVPAPQMLVGAMDLVESIARNSDTALESKRFVAQRAVNVAREVNDPTTGLECLRLIDERLRRTSFLRLQDTIGASLVDAVASLTQRFPDSVTQSSLLCASDQDLKGSWFGRGLIQGFRLISLNEPDKLLALRRAPVIANYFVAAEPEVVVAFIRAAFPRRTDPEIRSEILQWLAKLDSRELRSSLRASLVLSLKSDDIDILSELLNNIPADEVTDILDALAYQTSLFENVGVRDLIVSKVARSRTMETRSWVARQSDWSPNHTQIFAATFPHTQTGLTELLNEMGSDVHRRSETVAAFLQQLGPGKYPRWIVELAHDQTILLTTLLGQATELTNTVNEQIEKLLLEIPDMPVAQDPILLALVLNTAKQPFFYELLNVTMRSLIPGYVAGIVSESTTRPFQEAPSVVSWFQAVDRRSLLSLVARDAPSSTLHWFNAWQWIATAPTVVYSRKGTPLPEMIDSLARLHRSAWNEQISAMWSQIIRRARLESESPRTRMMLCVQALKFSFNNTQLPLGAVVASSFQDVYVGVTASSVFPPEAEQLFGFFDWDKGKELRRALTESFLQSTWRPSDLILAVSDVRLLRKIFKRIIRKPRGGERYLRIALSELEGRGDEGASNLAHALRDMLANPNFYEEWD